jgi:hypothetical protein
VAPFACRVRGDTITGGQCTVEMEGTGVTHLGSPPRSSRAFGGVLRVLWAVTSAWKSGPVRFFGPNFRDRDRDRSPFILELKKTGLDRKKPKTAVLDQS